MKKAYPTKIIKVITETRKWRRLILTTYLSSIRTYVLDHIKNFSWAYNNQGLVLAAFADYLLGDRDSSCQSYQRVEIGSFTSRQLGYSLEHGQFHLHQLKQQLTQRLSNFDLREAITLALDDTLIDHYGDHVYSAVRQFDHIRDGSRYANVLVDCWISSPLYLNYDFQAYLPRNYLERATNFGRIVQISLR